MDCPVCDGELLTRKYETEQIDQCNKCNGVWLDWGEVVNIIRSRDEKISHAVKTKVLAMRGKDHRPSGDIKCPVCEKKLETYEYALNSGVILDKCPDNHGIWFDAYELEKIQAIFERIDLRSGHSGVNEETLKSQKKCPRDGSVLQEINYESVAIDICEVCGGAWADKEELTQIVRDKETKFLASDHAEIIPCKSAKSVLMEIDLVDELECVVCSSPMERINYSHDSGVVIDRCRKHGSWLDKDELDRIQVYVERWDKQVATDQPKYGKILAIAKEKISLRYDRIIEKAKKDGQQLSPTGSFLSKFGI